MSLNTSFLPYVPPLPTQRTLPSAGFSPFYIPGDQFANSPQPGLTAGNPGGASPKVTAMQGAKHGAFRGMAISTALFSSLYIAAVSFGAVMVGGQGSLTKAVTGLFKMAAIGVVPGAVMGGTVGALKATKEESV